VPALTKVIVPDEIVQTSVVADVKATVKLLFEEADIEYVPEPRVLLFKELNVIVWEALPGVEDVVVDADPFPAALVANTLNV
jgi:hypothetical protein